MSERTTTYDLYLGILWFTRSPSLRYNLRNRIALVYGFAFPLLFLIGFWALYRNDPVPLSAEHEIDATTLLASKTA